MFQKTLEKGKQALENICLDITKDLKYIEKSTQGEIIEDKV